MSNIAYLPRIFSQPGAKLYWRASGTSTPQNVYTDIDLTVAHSNPVVADADGFFAKIYLDPSLPNYRMIHTNGIDLDDDYTQEVLLEPIQDDIPAGSEVVSSLRVKGAIAQVIFEETDQTSANKKWRQRVNGNSLTLAPLNDAEDTITGGLSIGRDGSVTIEDLHPLEGSFTGTLTGMAGATTGTINYQVVGDMVTLYHEGAGIFGTSNTTALSITGMPAGIIPSLTRFSGGFAVRDNGLTVAGTHAAVAGSTGEITLFMSGGFTNSGSKGIVSGWSIRYPL